MAKTAQVLSSLNENFFDFAVKKFFGYAAAQRTLTRRRARMQALFSDPKARSKTLFGYAAA
jgi:hypothetical protein